ncbi:DUF4124 domain-containing protein [Thalassotalea sp. ND16A]|uniref:DUF4124 domain-containing protein n=1 Tax=Thalassotalea sp. ND16A TaxID=1535422 RepID=UPI00051A6A8E|nr:DUF4124 domain-containing protein [Thalassotalea sp. ND16A]KGJ88246.1 hypothetical protein ND16A_0186 [Thalassotalea sp. ND16A]
MSIYRQLLILTVICSFSLVQVNNAQAKDVTVYRWVDENNVVHYSQHEPISDDFTTIQVDTAYSPVQAPLKDTALAGDEESKNNQLARASATKCKNAQTNFRTLSDFDKIEVTSEDGKSRLLSGLEKQQRLRLSEKEVELYCDSGK